MEGSVFHPSLSSLTVEDAIARLKNLDIHGFQVTRKGTLIMDPRIWGTLPPDLVEKVLAQLSVPSLILSRVVRKKWNKEVYHGQLLSHLLSAEAPKQMSWLFMFDNRGTSEVHCLWAYDQRADAWYQLSLESIPHFSVDQTRAGWRPCAAAGGLLCFNFSALPITVCWVLSLQSDDKKLEEGPTSKSETREAYCDHVDGSNLRKLHKTCGRWVWVRWQHT